MINTVSFPGLSDVVLTLNRVAFSVFGYDIMWYGVIIGSGFMLAALYAVIHAKEFELDTDFIMDILIWCLPAAIIGARLYYVAFRWEYFSQDLSRILNIRGGGLAFYGGFLGGVLGGAIVCKLKKRRFMPTLDMACIVFPLAQSIGRWGNFMNCEAFGGPTDLPWGMSINGASPVHPTFLYESIWNFIGFLLLHKYSKKRKFDGEMALLYLAWYGFGRMFIEGMRTDSLYIGSTNIRVSQLLAFIFFIVGAGLLCYMHMSKKYLSCPIFTSRMRAAFAGDNVIDIPEFIPTPVNNKEETNMKELTLFMLPNCPHCKLALKLQDELMAENPEYRDNIKINMINEAKESELANSYDYYYVPCYFYGKEKLSEGHVEKEDVEKVFKAVLAK